MDDDRQPRIGDPVVLTQHGTRPVNVRVPARNAEGELVGEKKIVAGGLGTKAQGLAAKVLPDSVKAGMHRGMAEPGSAD